MKRKFVTCLLSVLFLAADTYPFGECKGTVTPSVVITESQWKGKRVAFLGDSITDEQRVGTTKCYWEYLAEWLGLCPLVYGINGNEWNGVLQQAHKLREEQKDTVDAIVIFAGTNDFFANVPLGEWYTDPIRKKPKVADTQLEYSRKYRMPLLKNDTFKGRINRVLHFLKTNYPDKQVILLTPLHRAQARFSSENVQPDEGFANQIGAYIDEYVQAVKEAGNVWAVPVIDLHSLSGLYPLNDSCSIYFHDADTDRLHPNATGHRRMAKTLLYQLLALPATF
ncbi:SGNH/GDSL hydrolase family protein [Bacteroides thetaiotaomicron]|uniref:SGNH/GDSL hydrolase family protein n=1 Tax=Bacteroides thetaiotaomicron TaxID=818 RepID=UPI001F394EB5|nr:SGNH/GDSL hydrolase family protein [Bacteroides thetaiotaomicron]MCE8952328.1 SGNH/GDSL hydrolase family protein [Bacteroides thetaiotaomicron]MCE8969684.1 SGNH/GDSL hydrolase family protein [Bacteroides thetaiotaomicron]